MSGEAPWAISPLLAPLFLPLLRARQGVKGRESPLVAQRHPIPAPAGVPGPPPAHVAGRASAAPPRGAAPAATNAATVAVRSAALPRRACAGRRGECGRLSRSPAPSLHPPWLDAPLDTPERDAVSGWLLPCLNPPSRSGTPTSRSPTPGRGACGGLSVLSGPGHSERSRAPCAPHR